MLKFAPTPLRAFKCPKSLQIGEQIEVQTKETESWKFQVDFIVDFIVDFSGFCGLGYVKSWSEGL